MSEYLSKEEIKQWRSSLEKITLEEFAARLGKKIEEAKPTNDLIDIVLHGQPVASEDSWAPAKAEKITTIAQRAMEREQEIAPSPFSIAKIKMNLKDSDSETTAEAKSTTKAKQSINNAIVEELSKSISAKAAKTKSNTTTKAPKTPKAVKAVKEVLEARPTGDNFRDEVRIIFKKSLTDREQKVFDYFLEHKNEVVYAKDLATLLELPRDYVYKYIKNLRTKIEGDKLENAVKGGFILHV